MDAPSGNRPVWTVIAVPVSSYQAARLLRSYFTEIADRYFGRPATESEVDAAMGDDPSHELAPPDGLFLLARLSGDPAGCAGVRLLDPLTAEIKRMYVRPAARGRGGGACLLAAAEDAARRFGADAVRLDTRDDLVEARRLYARHGYAEIPRYSDNPYADHWFEKRLA